MRAHRRSWRPAVATGLLLPEVSILSDVMVTRILA
jgi:hypothetical protein